MTLLWPRLPDLSPCDFFLWEYLKSKVYVNQPQTLEELRANIKPEIARIKVATLKTAYDNFEVQLHKCVQKQCHHLTGVIF